VQATSKSVASLLALGSRLWQTFIYMGLWAVTGLTMFAMTLPGAAGSGWRRKTANRDPIQITFAVVILAYVVALSFLGGAGAIPLHATGGALVILIGVSTIWRRLSCWKIVVARWRRCSWRDGSESAYSFPFEDTSPYRDYVQLHQAGASYLEQHFAHALVLTAWTASE